VGDDALTTDDGASLVLRNDFQELKRLAPWIEDAVQRVALDAATSFAIQLCLDEAVANVIMHGKVEGRASRIVVRLQRTQDKFVLRIEDDGAPFDPTGVAPAKPAETLETTRIGGLGVHLMRKFSAGMHYERVADQNRLSLTFPANA
jgi:serine/threonine-protein kinase RsbW